MTGKIHSVFSGGTVDGPGIRFVVFMQGCPLRCKWCHNPEGQSFNNFVNTIFNYQIIENKGEYKLSYNETLIATYDVPKGYKKANQTKYTTTFIGKNNIVLYTVYLSDVDKVISLDKKTAKKLVKKIKEEYATSSNDIEIVVNVQKNEVKDKYLVSTTFLNPKRNYRDIIILVIDKSELNHETDKVYPSVGIVGDFNNDFVTSNPSGNLAFSTKNTYSTGRNTPVFSSFRYFYIVHFSSPLLYYSYYKDSI